MKKIGYTILITIVLCSCKKETKTPQNESYTILSGKIENSTAKTIEVKGYNFNTSIAIKEDGSFKDTLYLPEQKGYYDIIASGIYSTLFLENGSNLNMVADTKTFEKSVTYTGTNAAINNYLATRYLLEKKRINKDMYTLEEDAYKDLQNAVKHTSDSLLAAADLDEEFKKLEKENIYYNYVNGLMFYPMIRETSEEDEDFELSETFYEGIETIDYEDGVLYANIPSYRNLVLFRMSESYRKNYDKYDESRYEAFMATIKDIPQGHAKDEFMNIYTGFLLSNTEEHKEIYDVFMAEVQNETYKEEVRKKYNQIKKLAKGAPSPGFNYENYEGGTTSLEDLRGKYVYIDVWATWCGPCKKEFPALKQLEEKYRDNNIVFVSISVDTPNDYDNWKKMIAEENLGGIQLLADNNWESTFIKDYIIEGIPRFILIDPEGNIIDANAPIPSEKEDITSLFKELKL